MTPIARHLPRRTVRLRLTLLYVGLFLASAACLLVITYFLVAQQLPQVRLSSGIRAGIAGNGVFISSGNGGAIASQTAGGAIATPCPQPAAISSAATVSQCVGYLQDQAAGLEAQAVSLRSDTLNKLLIESGIAFGIMAVASVGLGWLMAGRVLSPLRMITTTARRISARNLHQRIGMHGPDDELKELGDTFDQLLGRLEASFRAQRQFVANASHELRTPLARQRTLLEVALRDQHATNDSLRTACERALAAGEQHERLIAAMLTLAQSERGLDRFEPVNLSEIAEDALLTRVGEAAAKDLIISTSLSPAPTLGDQNLAERLASNLIDNAIRYNANRGRLEVRTGMRDCRPFLVVSNTGVPVPPDQLGRLFEPFQRLATTREATGKDGLGLGLAIVSAIAAAHDAELRAHPNAPGGLTVEIMFPPRESPASLNGADRGFCHQPHASPRPAPADPAVR
ncbi:MAG: HAMP domain-containing histidine kinase [Streptosporangiaceae bacterium]|nr:HAMP domain-containing histidine kinase [Streptosporangiaceae bacterium]